MFWKQNQGSDLLEYMLSERALLSMKVASDLKRPAVEGISRDLIEIFNIEPSQSRIKTFLEKFLRHKVISTWDLRKCILVGFLRRMVSKTIKRERIMTTIFQRQIRKKQAHFKRISNEISIKSNGYCKSWVTKTSLLNTASKPLLLKRM